MESYSLMYICHLSSFHHSVLVFRFGRLGGVAIDCVRSAMNYYICIATVLRMHSRSQFRLTMTWSHASYRWSFCSNVMPYSYLFSNEISKAY